MINVSWENAVSYRTWLSHLIGVEEYRLPNESQSEYACRAGKETLLAFGMTPSAGQANYDAYLTHGSTGQKGEHRQPTIAVGSSPGNSWGLHEMHGSVREWVADAWCDSYVDAPCDGSTVADDSVSPRVLRGGLWVRAVADQSGSYPAAAK